MNNFIIKVWLGIDAKQKLPHEERRRIDLWES